MKTTREELIAKARKPAEDAMKLHPFYRGKMQTMPKCAIRDFNDFAIWYSPGVAAPCKAIQADKENSFVYTSRWNTIAVVSDGTRVLGLGDIGPEAGMPVMEGKALLFKYLGGVDAVPICLGTKDPEEIIKAVKWLQPSFGGINLEDIASPKCFYILDRLRKEMEIPVWHDDQQGTAVVTLAGLINALKVVGKKKEDVKLAVIGVGAANIAILRVLFADGFKPENTIIVDSKSILHTDRIDLRERQDENPYKWELAQKTNPGKSAGWIAEAIKDANVCVSLSKSGPDTIKPEWLKKMAKDAILFACANPIPEVWPWEAREAGVRIVATGRSDFPNQVNNSVGFPGIFRGALDVRASTITDEMCIAAAYEIAKCAEDRGLSEEYIIPTMAEWEVFVRTAVAIGSKAIEQGIARLKLTPEELRQQAEKMIKESRETTALLMKEKRIPPVPEL
ncbi:MAG: NADP-dependent malic enzyme [Dehalococcoidales bacterium]|nr:NADP-dependent malic enzyme [Dehalococcoidales bacterium]